MDLLLKSNKLHQRLAASYCGWSFAYNSNVITGCCGAKVGIPCQSTFFKRVWKVLATIMARIAATAVTDLMRILGSDWKKSGWPFVLSLSLSP